MCDLLIVPVRGDVGGSLTLHTGRLDQGPARVGIAFTDVARLRAALGETHRWIRLAEPALRALLRPMGITRIQVDPVLVGPRGEVALTGGHAVAGGAQAASAYS